MKNKKLKYILIFIFIVCLLIPISCINIYAYTWDYVNLTTSYFSTATIYSNISISGCEYITYHNSKTNSDVTITNGLVNLKLEKLSSSMAYYYINNTRCYESFNGQSYYITLSVYSDNGFTISYNKGNTSSSYNAQYTRTDYNSGAFYNDVDKIVVYKIEIPYNAGDYSRVFQVSFQLYKIHNSITFDKTYDLSFYNNDILYDSITISGASASGYAPFEEISQVKYGDTVVWNRIWANGYDNVLRYNQLMTQPNITTLNTDCANIISFTTQSFTATESITNRYQLGTFYNDSSGDVPYSDIYITGTVAIGTTAPFITISEIKYNNTSVYSNGSFYSGYSSTLYSYSNNPLNLTTINSDTNNIVTFTNVSLGTYVPINDILSGIAGIFGVTTTLIASAQANWILAIFMAMSVFMLLVLVIFKFVRGNSSGGSK